jgi:Fe-S-cluster-containing dehydrogenase component
MAWSSRSTTALYSSSVHSLFNICQKCTATRRRTGDEAVPACVSTSLTVMVLFSHITRERLQMSS